MGWYSDGWPSKSWWLQWPLKLWSRLHLGMLELRQTRTCLMDLPGCLVRKSSAWKPRDVMWMVMTVGRSLWPLLKIRENIRPWAHPTVKNAFQQLTVDQCLQEIFSVQICSSVVFALEVDVTADSGVKGDNIAVSHECELSTEKTIECKSAGLVQGLRWGFIWCRLQMFSSVITMWVEEIWLDVSGSLHVFFLGVCNCLTLDPPWRLLSPIVFIGSARWHTFDPFLLETFYLFACHFWGQTQCLQEIVSVQICSSVVFALEVDVTAANVFKGDNYWGLQSIAFATCHTKSSSCPKSKITTVSQFHKTKILTISKRRLHSPNSAPATKNGSENTFNFDPRLPTF